MFITLSIKVASINKSEYIYIYVYKAIKVKNIKIRENMFWHFKTKIINRILLIKMTHNVNHVQSPCNLKK